MGVPKAIRSDVPNLMKDVPNFVKDVPRVGSKVSFEVGIGPQKNPYGFQNEIMDHPCSNGGPIMIRVCKSSRVI